VIAVGIYRLQEKSSDEAPAPAPTPADKALTADQRASIESEFGIDSIEGAFDPGRGRGKRSRARLVRLHDGRLVSVYEDPAEAGSPSARSTRRGEASGSRPAPVDNPRRRRSRISESSFGP
jgi:hypothetical protein